MTCRPIHFADGASGFICTRARRTRCGVANCERGADHACDYPVTRRGRAATCDMRLCDVHRRPQQALMEFLKDGDTVDYCPAHEAVARKAAAP